MCTKLGSAIAFFTHKNSESKIKMGTQWNSFPLEITYEVFGWIAFFSWSISFYPQVLLNFRRKSVVGLNFDFVVLNLTKHTSYLIYNATLYFSSAVQQQYREKYGFNERGNQKVSKVSLAIVSAVWIAAAICVFIASPSQSWLWLISVFNTIQVVMTVIKYIPQAVMNFCRKSTDGFSIGNILLDFLGGVTNYGQMAVQSIDQGSWVNFYGNIGKTLLSLVSIFFDLLFMVQHYVLYPEKQATPLLPTLDEASKEALLKVSDGQSSSDKA
ncbi:hypothetical protein Cgig2_023641 [Carnegiea gigantea]|uniref:Cystinosin n=1 Tax=Carnegiea gigantea TaxID=171969 RepID=A0A9Q1KDD7_9CARY|nr:hypothetical protein Cgig2_023641 [Carnegiea gigantea]